MMNKSPKNKWGWPKDRKECLSFETLVNSALTTLTYAYTLTSRGRKSLPTTRGVQAPDTVSCGDSIVHTAVLATVMVTVKSS